MALLDRILEIKDVEDDIPQMGLSRSGRAALVARGVTKEGKKPDPSIIKADKKLSSVDKRGRISNKEIMRRNAANSEIPTGSSGFGVKASKLTLDKIRDKQLDRGYSSQQAGTSGKSRTKILGNLAKSSEARAMVGSRYSAVKADKALQKRLNKGSGGTMKPLKSTASSSSEKLSKKELVKLTGTARLKASPKKFGATTKKKIKTAGAIRSFGDTLGLDIPQAAPQKSKQKASRNRSKGKGFGKA